MVKSARKRDKVFFFLIFNFKQYYLKNTAERKNYYLIYIDITTTRSDHALDMHIYNTVNISV